MTSLSAAALHHVDALQTNINYGSSSRALCDHSCLQRPWHIARARLSGYEVSSTCGLQYAGGGLALDPGGHGAPPGAADEALAVEADCRHHLSVIVLQLQLNCIRTEVTTMLLKRQPPSLSPEKQPDDRRRASSNSKLSFASYCYTACGGGTEPWTSPGDWGASQVLEEHSGMCTGY